MPQLPSPFPVPDWQLKPDQYPTIFLVDRQWAESPFKPTIRSLITKALTGTTPLLTPKESDLHGEKTLQIVRSMAKGLPDQKIRLASQDRVNVLGNFLQYQSNVAEALMSIVIELKKGDLVVVNLGADGGQDSFACDPLIARLLEDIADRHGGIAMVAAGNTSQPLAATLTSDVVVVGGVKTDGTSVSRYGSQLTCYGVVPFALPDLPPAYTQPVLFGHSSAATAYTAGMVLMMINYARSNGIILTSKQVVGLLKANSIPFPVQSLNGTTLANGNLPDWDKLRPAIDVLT